MGVFDQIREKMLGAVEGKAPEEIDSVQDQPQPDQELVAFVRGRVDEVRNQAVRVSHEGIWMTNIAYLLGFDGVFYDPQQKQFRPSAGSSVGPGFIKRNRIRNNLILPAVQNRLARMLKVPPRYEVRPNSMEEDDKQGAQLGEEVIGNVWDKQKIDRKRIDLGMWTQQCGHSYVGVCFDDQLGDPLFDPETNEMLGYEGEIRVDVVSAFEGFADPLAKTFEECSWFARAKVRKLDYFRTHYPERGHLVKEEGTWLLSTQYEMRINTLNTVGPASSGTAEQMKGAAIEIHYYEKRSMKYPNGRHVVVANGVLLKNDELAVGEIPYAKFDDAIIGGKYYSESFITHVRPLQDQYNRTLQKRADWTNKLLAGKYMASRDHNLAQEALNDQSGEVILHDTVPNAGEPHAIPVPVIPNYAYTETADLEKQIYNIFGISEVSRGQLPSASIPAEGMQLLLEQDETRMGIEVEAQEHSWARVGMLILKYADKYYITNRKLKKKNKDASFTIRDFTGAELKKNFDVTVVRGSTVPNSKVLHRQEILNLYTQGLLGDPADPQVRDKVLAMLQYGDVSEAWEDNHIDMTQINNDLKLIEQEQIPDVDEKDNHVLHMIHKNRYRKSEKFQLLSPLAQGILQANIAAHTAYAMEQANPQLASPPDEPMPPPNIPPPPPEAIAPVAPAEGMQ